jgi:hypothetical protein
MLSTSSLKMNIRIKVRAAIFLSSARVGERGILDVL